MSLINQMLKDLEKRRASGDERANVPKHVRALPREERSSLPWWIAGASALLVVGGAAAWYLTQRVDVRAADAIAARAQLDSIASATPSAQLAALARDSDAAPDAKTRASDTATAPVRNPGREQGAAQSVPAASIQTATAAAQATPRIPASAVIGSEAPTAQVASGVHDERTAATPVAPARTRARPASAPPVAAPSEAAPERTTAGSAAIDKRVQQPTPQQLAESEFREGTNLLHQGRHAEAAEKFRLALQQSPGHTAARQGLVGLLVEAKRLGEAEQVLREGLSINPAQPGFAMALARMQVDRGDTAGAVETLHKSAPAAGSSADYIAFLAALLQRQNRHAEAVEHYQAALALAPTSGIWHMGLGISLQALNRTHEAREAFRRALASRSLNAELQAFVEQRLKQLH